MTFRLDGVGSTPVLVSLLLICTLTFIRGMTLEMTLEEDQAEDTIVRDISLVSNITSRPDHDPETTTYSFLGSEDNSYFKLDSSSGILSTGPSTDRDVICGASLECILELDVVVISDVNEVINIWISLLDRNDHYPSFTDDFIVKQISELSPIGSTISLPTATDADVGMNDVQDYFLEPSANDAIFRLDVQTLPNSLKTVQLVLLEELDAEDTSEYVLTLVARDGGSPYKTGTTRVTVHVSDANDNPVVFNPDQYEKYVNENLSINTTILQVSASDGDVGLYGQITYSLLESSQTSSLFSIDGETGLIYLSGTLDYEEAAIHHLIVEASDDPSGQPAVATVTIHVIDINDNSPVITINVIPPGAEVAQVQEHSRVGSVVAYVQVSDADSELNSHITCRLDNSMFRLEALDGGRRYEVSTAMDMDRESRAEHSMTVICNDGGEFAQQVEHVIEVEVQDINDQVPTFNLGLYTADVQENMEIGTSITQVSAIDLDLGINAQISFTLEGADSAYFTVGPSSGILRATHVFDYESQNQFHFCVVASDMGEPSLSATADMKVSIIDINDHAPRFNQSTYEFWVEENNQNGSFVGIVMATDLDSELYNNFFYSLSPTMLFEIDRATGVIRTTKPLDREVTSTHYLTVYATNENTHAASMRGETTVMVHVSDQNDNWPVITFPNDSNKTTYVSSKVPSGYDVVTIQAIDVDDGWNSEIVYSLTGGKDQELFTVDYATGVISTTSKLEDYNNEVLEIVIGVADQGVPSSHMSTAVLEVHVNDSVAFHPAASTDKEDDKLLLQGTHLNIVIALAVVSAVIVVILVVAIVLVKRQDRQKRNVLYKERAKTIKNWVSGQNSTASIQNGNNNYDSTNNTNSNNMNVSDDKSLPTYWPTDSSVNIGVTFQAHLAATQIADYSPRRSSIPKQADDTSHDVISRSANRSQSFTSYQKQASHIEYSKPIGRSSVKYENNGRVAAQKDTDSSCSNDSGRGLSEEGENSVMAAQPSPNIYAHTPSKPAPPPPPTASYSRGFTVAARPLNKQTPQKNYTPPCPSHLKSRDPGAHTPSKPAVPIPDYQRPVAGNTYNQNQPLGVHNLPSGSSRQSSYRYNPNVPNQDAYKSNDSHDNRGYHVTSQPRDAASSIYTSHDEMYGDNASTTSGSYFVNLHDFDDEDAGPTRSVEV